MRERDRNTQWGCIPPDTLSINPPSLTDRAEAERRERRPSLASISVRNIAPSACAGGCRVSLNCWAIHGACVSSVPCEAFANFCEVIKTRVRYRCRLPFSRSAAWAASRSSATDRGCLSRAPRRSDVSRREKSGAALTSAWLALVVRVLVEVSNAIFPHCGNSLAAVG